MKTSDPIAITSEAELKENARVVLKRINNSERGGLLFLLNPTYALEDAGFELSAQMQRHIRRGLRYGTKTKERMRKLEKSIFELSGHEVRVESRADLGRLLFDKLKLPVPEHDQTPLEPEEGSPYEDEAAAADSVETDYEALSESELQHELALCGLKESGSQKELITRLEDYHRTLQQIPRVTLALLEEMRGAHPVIEPIIEVRRLLKTGWRFVNRETYEKVKSGQTVRLIRGVKFRPKRDDTKSPC